MDTMLRAELRLDRTIAFRIQKRVATISPRDGGRALSRKLAHLHDRPLRGVRW